MADDFTVDYVVLHCSRCSREIAVDASCTNDTIVTCADCARRTWRLQVTEPLRPIATAAEGAIDCE